jgi:nitrogenase molybdenum-cofactor synthesis protein NifE
MVELLEKRRLHVHQKGKGKFALDCERPSLAGAVSQRACTFCGSRVVLYPIADAIHLVHGPVGCAAYTWDIRGSRSSGPELHRLSFTTDLREQDVIRGGAMKLEKSLRELIAAYQPKAAFVYSTCIVGVIGDDVAAVCRTVSKDTGVEVIEVNSEGFKGSKKDGYLAACDALNTLIGTGSTADISPLSINILGEFNIAGEAWIIQEYYRKMGVEVVATLTGDGRIADVRRAHGARLNVVQCSGSMMPLAKKMKERFGIPFIKVSYFGVEDVAKALYEVADHFGSSELQTRAEDLVAEETAAILPRLRQIRGELSGARAAIYTGGAFKAFSLVRALRTLGVRTVLAGSQTGNADDYSALAELCDEGTVIVDDTNPLELAQFLTELQVDLLIGGVKERPIAHKLGVGFCDHNHERKRPLAGFHGMIEFAEEVRSTLLSPVWRHVHRTPRPALPRPSEGT